MKFTISPELTKNAEALNNIIETYTDMILAGTIEMKQKFLADVGLGHFEVGKGEKCPCYCHQDKGACGCSDWDRCCDNGNFDEEHECQKQTKEESNEIDWDDTDDSHDDGFP